MAEQREGIERLKMPVKFKARRRQLRFVPDRGHRETNVRITRQQRFTTLGAAAGHRPGIAALELRQAGFLKRLLAEQCQVIEAFPVVAGQRGRLTVPGRLSERAFRLPAHVEDFQVFRAQLIPHIGHQRFSAKRRREAVRQIAADAEGVLRGERPLANAQHVELDRFGMRRLVLIDAVQIRLKRLPRRRVLVLARDIGIGVLADAQATEQLVGVDQLGPQHFCQLAACQPAQDFHLE